MAANVAWFHAQPTFKRPKVPSKLMFPLAKAEEVLRDRIERGNQVLANLRQSYTSRTKDPAKYLPFYENWKEFNTDLLGRMFSDPNYKLEYLNRIQRIAAPHTAPQLPYRLLTSINSLNEEIRCLSSILERLSLLEHHPTSSNNQVTEPEAVIFIGHGRSVVWRELRDFIRDRLHMSFEEFNRVSPAGISVTDRLTEMLGRADFAFLLLTGEDEQPDGSLNARLNVVHEAGLFQGKLGFRRAIVLLEEGCQEFSNIHGLGQIRFPRGNIAASFEEIRQVLEREKLLPHGGQA